MRPLLHHVPSKWAASTRKRCPSHYSRLDKISFAWVPGRTWGKVCAIRLWGAINTIDSVVEHPQLQAREAIVEVEHPVAGPVSRVGEPVKLSEPPGRVRAPAPLLGQHTDEVLQHHLELNEAEIAALREAGATGVKR